jgi:hypothetical protein
MKFGCCCLTSIPKTRFAKDASGATTKTVAKVHNYFLKPIDKEEDDDIVLVEEGQVKRQVKEVKREEQREEVQEEIHSRVCRCRQCIGKGRKISKMMSLHLTLCCVMCICVLDADARTFNCQSGMFVPASFTNCLNNGSVQTCGTSFTLTTTIQSVSGATCLTITDSNNNTVATGAIIYIAMNDRVSLATQYFTSRWIGHSQSSHRCYSAGNCDADKCSNCCPDKSAYGELSNDNVKSWPGQTTCRRTCGCATCGGCFLCDASCVFEGYALVPDGVVYRASSLTQRVHRPIVEVYLEDQQSTIFNTFVNTVGTTTTVGPITVQVVGSLSADYTEFGTNKVLDNSTSAWLVTASDVNSPQQQTIGDIQSSSSDKLTTASTSAFIFDPSIVSKSHQDTSTTFTFAGSGIDNLHLFDPFPLVLGGNLWSWSSGLLVTNVTNPGALIVVVSASSSLRFSRIVNVVCPSGSFLNGSGCFDCPLGFSLRITLKSTCSSGIVTLSVEDQRVSLLTNSISITTEDQTFVIFGTTSVDNNHFHLTIHANGGNLVLLVEFVAVSHVPVRNDTNSNQNSGDSALDKFGDFFTETIPNFFRDVFGGNGKWWEYLILVIVIIVVIAIIGLLIKPAISLYKAFASNSYERMSKVKKEQ